ncbi:hypothetical protein FQZ97_712760 [compost metagenome]
MLGAAVGEGVDALGDTLGIDVGDQVEAHLGDHLVAETVHLLELPLGIDVHHRERQLAGEERLARKVQHDGRIFTDGVQHHRVVELRGDLADDVDAFRLQLFQVRQFIEHGYSRLSLRRAWGDGRRAVDEGRTLAQPPLLFRRPLRPKRSSNMPFDQTGFGQSMNRCSTAKRRARYSPSAWMP